MSYDQGIARRMKILGLDPAGGRRPLANYLNMCLRYGLWTGGLHTGHTVWRPRSPAVRQNTRGKPGLAGGRRPPPNCLNMCLEIWALDGWTAYRSRCVRGATCGRQPVRQEYRGKPGLAAVEDRPYKFAPLNIAGMVLSIFVGIRPGDDNMVSANY